MLLNQIINESNFFPDIDRIEIDPDKVFASDVVDSILPTLLKIAYKNLMLEKQSHDRKFGVDSDYQFRIDENALIEQFEDVAGEVVGILNTLKESKIKKQISELNFKLS